MASGLVGPLHCLLPPAGEVVDSWGPRWSCRGAQSRADATSQSRPALVAGEFLVLTLRLTHQLLLATRSRSQQVTASGNERSRRPLSPPQTEVAAILRSSRALQLCNGTARRLLGSVMDMNPAVGR